MDGARQRETKHECPDFAADTGGMPQRPAAPRGPRGADPTRQRLSRIANTIEEEIVPRLMLAHRAGAGARRTATSGVADVAQFVQLVLSQDLGATFSYVESARARGMSLDSVYLELLAPAARHLGELWEADLCDFAQVTLGVWRLQQVMRELSPMFQNFGESGERMRRILLVPVRGEQHTFGLLLVADFLRHAGWDVWTGTPASSAELLRLVRSEWFAIVGISVACESHCEGLAADIHALRRASRNRALGVMVGGPLFVEHPERAALLGADATAVDARQACEQAQRLLAMLARRGREAN
jgi:methanogenic corrinoid protein MtbC1